MYHTIGSYRLCYIYNMELPIVLYLTTGHGLQTQEAKGPVCHSIYSWCILADFGPKASRQRMLHRKTLSAEKCNDNKTVPLRQHAWASYKVPRLLVPNMSMLTPNTEGVFWPCTCQVLSPLTSSFICCHLPCSAAIAEVTGNSLCLKCDISSMCSLDGASGCSCLNRYSSY